jgi:hypothetical protein
LFRIRAAALGPVRDAPAALGPDFRRDEREKTAA